MSLPIASDDETVSIPPAPRTPVPDDRWLAAPVRTENGVRTLGPGALGTYVGSFPFSAEARYTSPAGDQLGIGPDPPRVGEQTKYWVFWHVGPIQNAMQNLAVETTVGDRVTLTGNVALPDGGSSSISGRTIRWTVPTLGSDAGNADASFGFEIAAMPRAGDEGSGLNLIGPSKATAETGGGVSVQAEYSAQYSEIVKQKEPAPIHVGL
jgi:hypothetical protein